jgi:ABC-2 type transport system ATP-binding protein
MIRIEKLCKNYAQKKALDNLCLSISGGSIFGLLGPNGAGKTTLISILNGLTPFDSGEVLVFGMPLSSHLLEIRRRCSLIPQSLAFYENLSVIENLNFFAGVQKIKGIEKQKNINYAIEINRLGDMLKQKSGTLSGGQKRRLNIAIGLLNNPDILFFDEPTVGIDPQSRNEILATIQAFKEDNKAVIYTSHYMPEIEKICDQVAIINVGKIIKQGDISSMLTTDGQQICIELYETDPALLKACCGAFPVLSLSSPTTLSLPAESEALLGELLALFTSKSIKIKQINYATTNLESVFINLTSAEK